MISFRTVSGRRIDLGAPRIQDIHVEDVACGLSKVCRFSGQLRRHYSVAQHALMAAELAPRRLRFATLHHDDSEAYLGDVSRNLKHSSYMTGYLELEARWTTVIEQALNIELTESDRAAIKVADDLMAIFERAMLRDQLASWNPTQQIERSMAERYVSKVSSFKSLMAAAENLPREWWQDGFVLLTPEQAERAFLHRHGCYVNEL
jgi:5'-deoxynucleotidase YfbR-like HD superfamily hydrolase